jgi:hypothetical protein
MDILICLTSGSLGVLSPTPISHLFYRSIIFQHNPHACWCISPILVWAYKVCCGRTWTPAFTVIHTQTFLLPYCGIGDLPSVIWAAKQILPLMLHSHASFFCWPDGYDQHHGRLDSFHTCSTSIHLYQLAVNFDGAFSWYNLIIRLHFFMTSRVPLRSGYWV